MTNKEEHNNKRSMLPKDKPKKDKELTKQKLIDSVGKLLEAQEFHM